MNLRRICLAASLAVSLTGCSGSNDTPNFDTPEIASFMENDLIPDDVKQRFREALEHGGLAPERFQDATRSWRACNTRCVGIVRDVSASSLVLIAIKDGSEWNIGLNDATRAFRGRGEIAAEDIREGELVEALSNRGEFAEAVFSYSEPLQR